MSLLTVLRGIWLRLTIFDRIAIYTVIFLAAILVALRLAGYE